MSIWRRRAPAPGTAVAPPRLDGERIIPARLEIEVETFSAASHAVEVRGDRVLYRSGSSSFSRNEVDVTPSAAQWRRFFERVEGCGAWSWGGHYEQVALDGTSWAILIEHSGAILDATGSNAYPGGGAGPSREFLDFLRAARDLVGDDDFAWPLLQPDRP